MVRKERPRDFIVRQPVMALTRYWVPDDILEKELWYKLPEGWTLTDSILRFPAGEQVRYLVGGRDFSLINRDGFDDASEEQQAAKVTEYLQGEGFDQDEIKQFLDILPVEEWNTKRLSYEESTRWLKRHPELETEAEKRVKEIEDTYRAEREKERGLRR